MVAAALCLATGTGEKPSGGGSLSLGELLGVPRGSGEYTVRHFGGGGGDSDDSEEYPVSS